MPRAVNIYVKKQIRLDLLNIPQRQMYDLGVKGLQSIKERTYRARGLDDAPAPPLKSFAWTRIKKAKGLRPIRDLRGTGFMMWPPPGEATKRGRKVKNVGHLMDQITVRKVTDNRAYIVPPTTRAGRIKWGANIGKMIGFSPTDNTALARAAQAIISNMKDKIIKTFTRGAK